MRLHNMMIPLALIVSLITLSACSIDLERNDDGSLTATTVITEESFTEELEYAVRPRLDNVEVNMHDGSIGVSGERERPDGNQIDTITFQLDLSVAEGQLVATISDLQVNGQPGAEERVAEWNERIAQRLERFGDNHPNRTLQSVAISENDLTMVWRIETPRSRNDG